MEGKRQKRKGAQSTTQDSMKWERHLRHLKMPYEKTIEAF